MEGNTAMASRAKKKWSAKINTTTTFPPTSTYTRPAEEVAKIRAREEVSPLGIGLAIRMVQMFINRAGKILSPDRKRELEKAKRILQAMKASQPRASRRQS